jgi:DNA-binding SARP family transcriptional activator
MLDDHREKPVTWVSGPAGSGKTTLVSSYLRSNELPCLWYRVDAGDADIATFFYYMGMTAKKAASDGHPPLPLFTPEYLMGIPVFAKRYFEELYSRLKPPFVVVLDNYQEAPLDSTFQEIIHTGLSCIPEGIRVIVLSRNEPPAIFIRLRTGMMQIIGWNDIRFTEEESKNAVRLKDHRTLDAATQSLLYRKTQGWVAGLVFLIECSRSKNIDYQLLDRLTPEEIFDFFAIEIFRKANYETRAFLLKTCFLPTITVQMAEKLTCLKSSGQILSGLEKNHYFIERRLKTDPVYSYHPLFREFLVAKAKETLEPDEIAEIRRDTALLLMDVNQTEDAAGLLLDAEDWDRFIPFVLSQASSLLAQGRRATLETWLNAIPQKTVDDTPWLLYWQGVCRLGFISARSRDFFERSFYLFEVQGDTAGALWAWSGVINSIFFDFDDFRLFDPWIDWLDTKMSQGIAFPSDEVKLSVSTSVIVALIHRMPTHPRLKEWVEKTLPLSLQGVNIVGCMPTYPFFVFYYLSIGDFDDCAVIVNEMRRMAGLQTASPLLVITLKLVEALLCTTSAQLHGEGMKAVSAGLELARNTGAHLFDPLLLGVGVQNALNAMDMPMAVAFLDKMENVLKCGCRGHAGYYFYLSAWYHLCAGNPSRAVVLGEKCMQVIEEVGLTFSEADCRVILALTAFETGNLTKARQQLDAIGTLVLQSHNTFLEYRYQLLEAHFAFARNAQTLGEEYLTQAMTLGRQKGFVTMVNFWRPAIMSNLCSKALETEIEVAHVRNLVLKLDLKPDTRASEIDHWPWPVQITTLGGFEISKDGKKLEFPTKTPHKLLALLKALIACGARGTSEEQLADLLWPDSDGDTALKSLEISLYRLRKLLGDPKVIGLREGRVKLATDCCRVDAHAFEELLDQSEGLLPSTQQPLPCATGRTPEGLRLLERAVKLYRGAFLDGSTNPWTIQYRERLRYRFLQAVIRLGAFYEGTNHFNDAIQWYGQGIEVDAGAEPFYRGLMRCYLVMGRSSEAVTVYHRCKKIMISVFGVNLSREMEELYRQVTI